MQHFSNFLEWYNIKDVAPKVEAMKKIIDFYYNKGIDMLELGCTIPNLAKIRFHK